MEMELVLEAAVVEKLELKKKNSRKPEDYYFVSARNGAGKKSNSRNVEFNTDYFGHAPQRTVASASIYKRERSPPPPPPTTTTTYDIFCTYTY